MARPATVSPDRILAAAAVELAHRRHELAEVRLLKLSSLPADVFITRLQDTMRRALVVDAGKPTRST